MISQCHKLFMCISTYQDCSTRNARPPSYPWLRKCTTWLTNLKWPRICGIRVDENGVLALMKYPQEEEEEEGSLVMLNQYKFFSLAYFMWICKLCVQTACIQKWLQVLCWHLTTWPPSFSWGGRERASESKRENIGMDSYVNLRWVY